MKILESPLQISRLEEEQRITERPPPAWFAGEKKITTVIFSCVPNNSFVQIIITCF